MRRWIEAEIDRVLGIFAAAPGVPAKLEETALAICAVDEIAELFKLVSGNFFVTQVLFELARETPQSHTAAPFHSFDLGEISRHAQLADGNQLFQCLDTLDRALQEIGNDPNASLFAFDDGEHVYIHETTYHSIRQVWLQLARAYSLAAKNPLADAQESAAFGLPPFRVAPYEPAIRPEHAVADGPKAGAA